MRTLTALLLLLSPVQLTEPDRVRAELHQTHVTLLACQEQLVSAQIAARRASLTDDQIKLEHRFRELLKPAEGATFNWTSLEFETTGRTGP